MVDKAQKSKLDTSRLRTRYDNFIGDYALDNTTFLR
jgi:hypothetical protein